MSQKSRNSKTTKKKAASRRKPVKKPAKKTAKKVGRPKGTEKTGGRKPGTPNKSNLRMRHQFEVQGFNFAEEFVKTYDELSGMPLAQMSCLLKIAPFFMQRLREDVSKDGSLETPPKDPAHEDLENIPTSQLVNMLHQDPRTGH